MTLPVTAATFDVIASGGIDYGSALEAGALAVAPDGTPWLVHSEWAAGVGTNVLCTPEGDGSWRRIVLNERVELAPGRCFGVAPSIVFDAAGRLVGVTTTEDAADEVPWGHPASEVVRFVSADGGATFAMEQLSTTDPGHRALVPPPGAALGDCASAGFPRHPLPGRPSGRQPPGDPVEPGALAAVTSGYRTLWLT